MIQVMDRSSGRPDMVPWKMPLFCSVAVLDMAYVVERIHDAYLYLVEPFICAAWYLF